MQVQNRQNASDTLKIARVFIQVDFFDHWRWSIHYTWFISSVERLQEISRNEKEHQRWTQNEMEDSCNKSLTKLPILSVNDKQVQEMDG